MNSEYYREAEEAYEEYSIRGVVHMWKVEGE